MWPVCCCESIYSVVSIHNGKTEQHVIVLPRPVFVVVPMQVRVQQQTIKDQPPGLGFEIVTNDRCELIFVVHVKIVQN